MKRILFALMFVSLLSCKKNEDVQLDLDLKCKVVARVGSNTQIIGKWKLVKIRQVFGNSGSTDYSCNEVIYNFRSDGRLFIASDSEDIADWRSEGFPYELFLTPLYESTQGFTLKINSSSTACYISKGIMTLDDSPLDGPITYLVRM